jgi:hypothetical protein
LTYFFMQNGINNRISIERIDLYSKYINMEDSEAYKVAKTILKSMCTPYFNKPQLFANWDNMYAFSGFEVNIKYRSRYFCFDGLNKENVVVFKTV